MYARCMPIPSTGRARLEVSAVVLLAALRPPAPLQSKGHPAVIQYPQCRKALWVFALVRIESEVGARYSFTHLRP